MPDETLTTPVDPAGGVSQEQAPETFDAEYVAKLRAEAAKYRTEAKTAKSQLSQLQPLADKAKQLEEANQSEAEKLAQKLAEMQTKLDVAQAAAERATAVQKLTTLAAKAGVSSDILPFLDVSKFDLDNETETLATLAKLKTTAAATNGGSPSNPSRNAESNGQLSPADWYKQTTGRTSSIFGGK